MKDRRGLGISRGAVAGGLAIALLFGAGLPAVASAATQVEYRTIDLPDPGGDDLWRAEYFVSGRLFVEGEGLSILFDETSFGALGDPPAAGADWDVMVLQPDPLLPDAGRYDARALRDSPSLASVFAVSFVWRGPGPPASQPFEIYGPSFETLETGETSPVPEPGAFALVAVGCGGLGAAMRRRRR
ncbi:hypothetical protein MYXO_01456 [Myxococcaceae bacterium]|nr:hypothetical protein MYXO_01456 [Myxococcaceae bacterium]